MLGGKVILIFGENDFGRSSELSKLKRQAEDSNFAIETFNAEDAMISDFDSAISAVSLFSEKRFVIAKNLSSNKNIWEKLSDLLKGISPDVCLCLVEEKIDKRSLNYKNLIKIADAREQKVLTMKDSGELAEFARKIAKNFGENLDLKLALFLVEWVGANEFQIKNAVERLGLIGDFSEEAIKKYVPQNIESDVFGIFELVFKGEILKIVDEISRLKITEGRDGAYKFLGLFSGQIFNLVALKIGKMSGKTTSEIAKEISANAWVLGKMENLAVNLSQETLSKVAEILSNADFDMKNSATSPWDCIENALLEINLLVK